MKDYSPIEVLVIEDNPDDSELTIHAVKRGNRNAQIIHKWNGEEAISFIKSKVSIAQLVLIMLNLRLPKIDGFEVLRRIRDIESTKTTPVVILTASEEAANIS